MGKDDKATIENLRRKIENEKGIFFAKSLFGIRDY